MLSSIGKQSSPEEEKEGYSGKDLQKRKLISVESMNDEDTGRQPTVAYLEIVLCVS